MSIINLGQSLFQKKSIPTDCDVVFVSDLYIEDYVGGAELTTQSLLDSSPLNIFKLKSSEVTLELLQQGHSKYWIFGNFSSLNKELIPSICANMQYSILEYDYKYCKYRSPEKHKATEQVDCNCQDSDNGKLISALFYAARSIWWMSEKQQARYNLLFPFLKEKNSTVLSSVFSESTFATIKLLKEKYKEQKKEGWIIMGSPSWIKGTQDATEWCEKNSLKYKTLWGLSYDKVLDELAQAEGFVFLPKGGDTCPRMVIEAKLLGCKLHLNDYVEHKDEIWFNTSDELDTLSYLYMSRERFWNGIKSDMSYHPKLSGYTTTKDCITQDYPYVECIQSMLGFCDEVVVVDGGSTDGTWESLVDLAKTDQRIVIHQQVRDWNHPRFAVFDGAQKALARSLCTGDYCWQQDSDEIVHENDYRKILDIVKFIPKNIPLLSLPVIEYWGDTSKVRIDVNVWKWRLSQNLPTTTHGIPKELRSFDEDGNLFSEPGCDGCFYVKSDSYEMMPAASFYTPDVEQVRQKAFSDHKALQVFEGWFNQAINSLPSVYHFSWFNIERKIKTYKNYWSKHWQSMHNIKQDDTAENNMFFDKKWSDVSDEEIKDLALKLKNQTGGWVFHRKINFSTPTPHVTVKTDPPAIMKEWIKRNS